MSNLIKIVARRLGRVAAEAKTAGGMRAGGPHAYVDAGDLSILAKWAENTLLEASPAASPPEGAPTYAECSRALESVAEQLGKAASYYARLGWWDNEHDARSALAGVRDLLSRIPKDANGNA